MSTEAVGAEQPRLIIDRRFAAAPERVFDAWTDPAVAGQWLFTSPASEISRHDLDARRGRRWTITDRRDGTDYTASGDYLEVDRPRRLVFTFVMLQFSPISDRISVEVSPVPGGCRMTFAQSGAGIAEELAGLAAGEVDGSEQGWGLMFDRLTAVLARGAGHGARVAPGTLRFERILPGPIERVWAYLADPDKRGQWLATGEIEPRVGSAFELRFHHASLSPNQAPAPEHFKAYENGVTGRHEVTRYEPPHVLGITWGGEEGEAPSEVVFELMPQGDRVRLVLTHRRLANRKDMVNVSGGWHTHLAVLVETLEGRTPPAFWTLFDGVEAEYERRLPPDA